MSRPPRAPLAHRLRQLACRHPQPWQITMAQYTGIAQLQAVHVRCARCRKTITARARSPRPGTQGNSQPLPRRIPAQAGFGYAAPEPMGTAASGFPAGGHHASALVRNA